MSLDLGKWDKKGKKKEEGETGWMREELEVNDEVFAIGIDIGSMDILFI